MKEIELLKWKNITLIFAWYDFWIGGFWNMEKKRLYIFLVPMLGFKVQL